MADTANDSELLDQLIDALQATPGTRAEIDTREFAFGEDRVDAIIHADIAGHPVRVLVECKKHAFPRDVHQAVWQLRNYISHIDNGIAQWVPLLAATAISPGARELLRDEGIGYFDSGGSLYLPAPGAFLFIDKPMPKAAARKVGSVFRGRRAQVLHAVWERRHDWFGVHQLAADAMVSAATSSETLVMLERHGWVTARGVGPAKERRLEDARGLLDAWAEHQRSEPPLAVAKYFVPDSNVATLMRRLDEACDPHGVMYEVTGEAAGQAYASYLSSISQVRCRIMPGAPAEAALRALGARPVDEGWNLGVIEAEAEGQFAFRQRGEGAWLASPLQVYLDLLQGGGRSRELAAHLREELLH
jgi:hypothetical protein